MTETEISHRYKMAIAYDGTSYSGWQKQLNAVSIQEIIEKCLRIVLREPVSIIGAGRTDAGVHAAEQIAHFSSARPVDARRLAHALNAILPHDIRILNLNETAQAFHAQRSSKGKIYHYHIWTDPVLSPFVRPYRTHIRIKFDKLLLASILKQFLGTHDFTSFANSAHEGAAAKDAIRTIWRIDICEQEGGFRIEFEGEGFLYKMIRNMVGTALDLASQTRDFSSISSILAARDRRLAGQAAPPQGLILMKVLY